MRVAITISYTKNWKDIAEIVIPNVSEYATRNGYSMFVTIEEPYKKYTGLEKLRNVQLLIKKFDVVLSLDCDCLITNMGIKIESFLNDRDDFYVCEGMNMGVFIIKGSNWSMGLTEELVNRIKTGANHCEQDALRDLMEEAPPRKMKILPHPAFNSYLSELYPEVKQPVNPEHGQWVDGSFILHLPALSLSKRIEIMKSIKIRK